jgi:hypothetical protein
LARVTQRRRGRKTWRGPERLTDQLELRLDEEFDDEFDDEFEELFELLLDEEFDDEFDDRFDDEFEDEFELELPATRVRSSFWTTDLPSLAISSSNGTGAACAWPAAKIADVAPTSAVIFTVFIIGQLLRFYDRVAMTSAR